MASVTQSDVRPTGDQAVWSLFGVAIHGDWAWNIFYGHSPFCWFKKGIVSFWQKNVHMYWLTA